MNIALKMISSQENRNQQKFEKIAKLQKQIENSNNYLDKQLINHFISSDEVLDSESLFESLGNNRTKNIILNILKKTTLTKEVILQPMILRILELLKDTEIKKVEKNIEKSFQALSFNDKITFALYCSGLDSLYNKYSFAYNFLFKEFEIRKISENAESFLGVDGYNFEKQQSVLKLTLRKNDFEGAQRISKNLYKLISTGCYQCDNIDIFESTLSQHYYFYMKIEKIGNEFTPIVCRDKDHSFISEKESLLEQLTECIEYIAKYNAYYGVNYYDNDED